MALLLYEITSSRTSKHQIVRHKGHHTRCARVRCAGRNMPSEDRQPVSSIPDEWWIHTYMHACMHADRQAGRHTHTHAYTYTHTYMHTYKHTHTYIHTYSPKRIPVVLTPPDTTTTHHNHTPSPLAPTNTHALLPTGRCTKNLITIFSGPDTASKNISGVEIILHHCRTDTGALLPMRTCAGGCWFEVVSFEAGRGLSRLIVVHSST